MSPKSLAVLLVGMILVSSVFVIFHVTYPENPAKIQLHVQPKKPQQLQIFQHQSYNLPQLGINQTTFTPTGNTSLVLEGYVHSSSGQPLGNMVLGVAVLQAFTNVTTNSTGYYHITVLSSGEGTFAYKMFQYNSQVYPVYLGQNMASVWQNVTLTPQVKYSISGYTLSHGSVVPGVGLLMKGFWGQYLTSSQPSGSYSLTMVNGNYTIFATKTGFSGIPSPETIRVSNSNIQNFNITLNETTNPSLYMSGYVFNQAHSPIPGAEVSVIPATTSAENGYTNATGYYNISVPFYKINIGVNAVGYAPLSTSVTVTKNLTDENFTLLSANPYNSPGSSGQAGSGYPNNMSANGSSANYSNGLNPVSVSGTIYLNGTGMPVPNQNFTVYVAINGTYFYDHITTNQTGGYTINMQYPGQYNFTFLSTEFNETYLNVSLPHSVTGKDLNVTTSPKNLYSVSGRIVNGVNNSPLANATINITGPNGQLLETIHTNSTGNFSFTGLSGNYYLNVTYPGFGSVNYKLPLDQNITNLTIGLPPTSNVSPGSQVWNPSSGSGLPGANATNITSQLNGAGGGSGGGSTTSSGPVYLEIQMLNATNDAPITYTAYVLYLEVNGVYLRINGTTNGTGMAPLVLNYGGTYSAIPEMIQYNGTAQLINTSSQTGPVIFHMNPLKLYSLDIGLYNTVGVYGGSSVPLSGLSSTSYILPLNYTGSPVIGANFTLVNYSVPNGSYYFTYSNSKYVPKSFSQVINGTGAALQEGLDPYVMDLSWSSPIGWNYTLKGTGLTGGLSYIVPGSGSTIMALTQGSFTFNGYVGSAAGGGSKSFTLNSANYEENVTYQITGNVTNMSMNFVAVQSGSQWVAQLNTSLPAGSSMFLSYFDVNVSTIGSLTLSINGAFMSGTSSGGYFNLSNYFATGTTTATQIIIITNPLTAQQETQLNGNSVAGKITMQYYTAHVG